MQYLFTLCTSDLVIIPFRVPDGSRLMCDYNHGGLCVSTRKGEVTNVFQVRPYTLGDSKVQCLEEFLSLRNVHAFVRNAIIGDVDVYMLSSSITRTLSEKGVLPHEVEFVQLFRGVLRHITYHPSVGTLQKNTAPTNSTTPLVLDHVPALKVVDIPPFHISQQYFSTFENDFNTQRDALPALKSPNLSCVYMPLGQPLDTAIPILKQVCASISDAVPGQGRRVQCILLLDEHAPSIDLRLLTPETLATLEVLRIQPKQYTSWTAYDDSPESSVERRSALFRSKMDFRFSPKACDYHWRVIAFSADLMEFTQDIMGDWHCILYNTNSLDYAHAYGIGPSTVRSLRDSKWARAVRSLETRAYLDLTAIRIAPSFKLSLHIKTKEIVHAHEKALERKLRTLGGDQYMASLGFLWKDLSNAWSSESYNQVALRTNGYLSAEHIDKCYSGFQRESALKLVNSPPPCNICDDPCERMIEACGHLYCSNCIKTMFEMSEHHSEPCPTCRNPFSPDNVVEIKKVKSLRRRSKELPFARQSALRDFVPEMEGPIQQDLDHLCIVTLYNATIDRLQEWCPGVHICSLETLGPRTPASPRFSQLILLSPYIPSKFYLENLHTVLQTWTRPEFELHVIALENGAHRESTEFVSALAKSYESTAL